MNKKNLNQLLFLLACTVLQNNGLNAMKRSIELISGPETTAYPPSKKQKRASNAAALVCGICNKSFTQKGNLTKHKMIHTGEKPFSCSLCDKSFSLKCNLTVHERTHSGEKPFFCSTCNKSFTQQNSLTAHERTHTGEKSFSCTFCDKNFAHKSNLTKHIRIHTGEKPFSCSLCDKSFTQKNHLTKHMVTHTKNDAPPINSSKASSKKTPTNITPTLLVPLVIQKTIENPQTQKNETVIQQAMQSLNDKDFSNWISSEKFL